MRNPFVRAFNILEYASQFCVAFFSVFFIRFSICTVSVPLDGISFSQISITHYSCIGTRSKQSSSSDHLQNNAKCQCQCQCQYQYRYQILEVCMSDIHTLKAIQYHTRYCHWIHNTQNTSTEIWKSFYFLAVYLLWLIVVLKNIFKKIQSFAVKSYSLFWHC